METNVETMDHLSISLSQEPFPQSFFTGHQHSIYFTSNIPLPDLEMEPSLPQHQGRALFGLRM